MCNTILSTTASFPELPKAWGLIFVTMDSHFCLQSHGDPHSRRSTRVVAEKPNHQSTPSTNHKCCSGDGVHGCGCGCPCCTCRHKPVKDESNRTAYTSEGARDIPRSGTSDYDMGGSSLDSHGSGQSQISNNSYEAQDPTNEHLAMGSSHENPYIHRATATIATFTAAFDAEDEDDEHPYHRFLSPSTSFQPPSDESSGLLFGNMDGSSMMVGLDGSESGMASNLSTYESAWHNMTVSQAVTGTGESFPVRNNFLRLTPECRHERTRQMCRYCVHY